MFVAHTARDRVDVIDHDASTYLCALDGFAEAAGVVAAEGNVLITSRAAAQMALLDAGSLTTKAIFDTGPRPNGVAIVPNSQLAIVACIGDRTHGPVLQVFDYMQGHQRGNLALPGRPRWCVPDVTGARVFLAICEPSMVLVAGLPQLDNVRHWTLPVAGAHGLDIDCTGYVLYVACDAGGLVAVDPSSGAIRGQWPLAGSPDVTFFNPTSALVHVAIAEPGLVQSIDPSTGKTSQILTGPGVKTSALVPPDHLFVFSPAHGGVLALVEG